MYLTTGRTLNTLPAPRRSDPLTADTSSSSLIGFYSSFSHELTFVLNCWFLIHRKHWCFSLSFYSRWFWNGAGINTTFCLIPTETILLGNPFRIGESSFVVCYLNLKSKPWIPSCFKYGSRLKRPGQAASVRTKCVSHLQGNKK